jgi:hypothetical protein
MRRVMRIAIGLTIAHITGNAGAAKPTAKPERVLVVRKEFAESRPVLDAFRASLPRVELEDFAFGARANYEEFAQELEKIHPRFLLLIDNRAVDFALRWNAQHPAPERVRGVAILALNLRSQLKGNHELCGIAFETPPYTLATEFRYLAQAPVTRLLTFYRKSVFEQSVREATEQLHQEGITLEAVNVEAEGADLATSLKQRLQEYGKYDALWVMLDSVLLKPELFRDVWLPALKDSKLPVLAGVQALVARDLDFGVFAIEPDFSDLGSQAAQQMSALLGGAEPESIGIESYIGARKIVNLPRAARIGLDLKPGPLRETQQIE